MSYRRSESVFWVSLTLAPEHCMFSVIFVHAMWGDSWFLLRLPATFINEHINKSFMDEGIKMSRWWGEICGAVIKWPQEKNEKKVTTDKSQSLLQWEDLYRKSFRIFFSLSPPVTFYSGFISCMPNIKNVQKRRKKFDEMEQIEKERRFCAGGDFLSDIIIITFKRCFLPSFECFLVLIDRRESW